MYIFKIYYRICKRNAYQLPGLSSVLKCCTSDTRHYLYDVSYPSINTNRYIKLSKIDLAQLALNCLSNCSVTRMAWNMWIGCFLLYMVKYLL